MSSPFTTSVPGNRVVLAGASVTAGTYELGSCVVKPGYSSTMSRAPIVVAKVTLASGLILLAIAIAALGLQGLSDWGWPLGPLGISLIGLVWVRRANKYGTLVPAPKHAANHTR